MTGLSFKAAVALATNPEILPGVQFVALKDLRSHTNFRTVEDLEKAQAALRAEGVTQPVRADIMESFCEVIDEIATATRNGYYRQAINLATQTAARLRVFKAPQGVRTSIPLAVRHLAAHIKFQEKAGKSVKAHVGRTMQRVSDFSVRRKAEREEQKAKRKNRKGRKHG
jgi:hypothetical protein